MTGGSAYSSVRWPRAEILALAIERELGAKRPRARVLSRTMIRHILLLEPRSDATAEAIDVARAAITSLVGRIPGLLNCHWGENIAAKERQAGFTHGFTMDFVDQASLDGYGPHADHRPAAALVRAAFGRIVVLDFML
jgi:hypothetical protein